MRITRNSGLFVFILIALGALLVYQLNRTMYPYGPRPAALPMVVNALRVYAHDNNHLFPDVDGNPYRSLEALYPDYISAVYLAGLSGNRDKTTFALKHGKLLSAENCSLTYIPGLLDTDDENIAIVWENHSGIAFNGSARPGRAVGFINGTVRQITDDKWNEFVEQQKEMRNSALRDRKHKVITR